LRGLRQEVGLTQEELAEAAALSVRAVTSLERGKVSTPQKETVRLLADALGLAGPARAGFEAAARGQAAVGGVAAATRTLPRDVASFTGRARELDQLAGAGGVVGIHAIGGMAGVGKGAFAVRAAHQLAGQFPDDRLGQANTLSGLGDARRQTGEYSAAVQVLEQALDIYRDLGDRLGQAGALLNLGEVRRVTGEYQAAANAYEQALGISRDPGDRLGRVLGVILFELEIEGRRRSR